MSSSIRLVVGSLLSVVGVSLVAMNGIVNFHLRPLGDMMALGAMVSWGGYSILIDKANACGVIPVIAVQKAFGWAVIMMLPLAMWGTTDVGFITLDGSYSVTLDPSANLGRFSSLSNWGILFSWESWPRRYVSCCGSSLAGFLELSRLRLGCTLLRLLESSFLQSFSKKN